MNRYAAAALGIFLAASGANAFAAAMTKEQGDAILKELREIKQMLIKQQQQPAAPAGPQVPQKLTVKADSRFVLGKSDAPLTIVEFTDFQCPFCGRFESTTFPELKKDYIDTGKVRLILRDLPLDGLHPYAIKAAQSVRCAGDQEKFWEMKEAVFRNQNRLDNEALEGYARDLALNMDAFRTCMSSGSHLQEIGDDAQYAQSLGINGTPTFIIGKTAGSTVEGRVIPGALPYASFKSVLDELLATR